MKKIVILILLMGLLVGCGSEDVIEDDPIAEEVDYSMYDDMKENIVGKSDKDIKEIISRKPSDVRNDTTGKWKKSTISKNANIEEYILSYANTYMEEDEIHYIINFTLGTTTDISYVNGLLYVDIKEYEDKEEHDASKIGNGMLLKEYIIYPDGDVEEI